MLATEAAAINGIIMLIRIEIPIETQPMTMAAMANFLAETDWRSAMAMSPRLTDSLDCRVEKIKINTIFIITFVLLSSSLLL